MAALVAKEDIPSLKIIPAFVDNTERWLKELEYALRLGNEHKGKTHIVFETTKGPREVTTTIWSLSDHYLELKGGTLIPLNSIIEIFF
ncbi:MAG: hypothetical protein JST52_10595 [Bacteroidetes bacterium]|nr:hypothetical protein [Bacteroidota bacterium]MBS1739971.1 hypothetical protein [Bacteroidota bacterium]MBS1777617.1 hypothetical protein [Bacteroidota bacterium]